MSRSSASMFALHASLGLLFLSTTGCRDLKGQCSKRTDTLCLQVSLADSAQVPEAVSLFMTTDLDAETIARKAMAIAADICVYTNGNLTVERISQPSA